MPVAKVATTKSTKLITEYNSRHRSYHGILIKIITNKAISTQYLQITQLISNLDRYACSQSSYHKINKTNNKAISTQYLQITQQISNLGRYACSQSSYHKINKTNNKAISTQYLQITQ